MKRLPHSVSAWLLLVAAAVGAILASGRAGAETAGCNPSGRLVDHTVVFCGPATAGLSVFTGALFRSGTCGTRQVNGVPQFTVKLGARTQNETTNDGRPYFGLIVTGRLSSPTGGGVVAYWKGKRWEGVGVSFRGDSHAGSFVASGINKSHGHAPGGYRC